VLSLNIGNPSLQRAERQLRWLAERDEHVLILTETAASDGCRLLAERLTWAGWQVRFPLPHSGERGVMIASRLGLEDRGEPMLTYLPARAEQVRLTGSDVQIIGVYVPSRDQSQAKTERKRAFITQLIQALPAAPVSSILAGDLNVLEADHHPRYRFFQDWEYALHSGLADTGWLDAYRLQEPTCAEHSWVSRDGDGFRYDHIFISADLREQLTGCTYLHETRESELTDHSAMALELRLAGSQELTVEPLTLGETPSLF
jgi:exodeoxyribonuclease-3